MAVINGTSLLVYADGGLIAAQRGVTITTSQNLFDISSKDSAGWAEHTNGQLSSEISIDGLASTTGTSSAELFDYIISRKSLMLVVEGMDYPIVCEADLSSSSLSGPVEDVSTLSGSFKVKGRLFYLQPGLNPNLVTDPDGSSNTYDTLTISGIKITSAINLAGGAFCTSNTFAVNSGDVFSLIVVLNDPVNEAPAVYLQESGGAAATISNEVNLVDGLNVVTLTATATKTGVLNIHNSADCTWNTSNIYLFKL